MELALALFFIPNNYSILPISVSDSELLLELSVKVVLQLQEFLRLGPLPVMVTNKVVLSNAIFALLAPCQWGSHPDSHIYTLMIIF